MVYLGLAMSGWFRGSLGLVQGLFKVHLGLA